MAEKTIFQERLQKARREAGYRSAQDFANAFGEPYNTITSWENRGFRPQLDTFVRLCKFLGVSADYMLGLSDSPNGGGINQVANHSPHTTQTAGNCTNCPFAESYRSMADALTAIALKGTK